MNALPVEKRTIKRARHMKSEIRSVIDHPPTPRRIERRKMMKQPTASATGTQIASFVPVSCTPKRMIAVESDQMNQLARFGVGVFPKTPLI